MSFKYFSKLNYTLANEDTALEAEILRKSLHSAGISSQPSIASVCGSGSRVLPLFSSLPKSMLIVDLSKSQLLLCELRIATVAQLSHEEFLNFWGFPSSSAKDTSGKSGLRKEIFFNLQLSNEVKTFFLEAFEVLEWQPLLYVGKWESTFVSVSKIARKVLGNSIDELFECKSMEEHLVFLARRFPRFRFEMLLRLIGNGTFFNAMLYRGHFPSKNTPGSHTDYYRSAFLKLFAQGPAQNNFFLQLIFLGKLCFESGNPTECAVQNFEKIKKGIEGCHIQYVQGNAVDVIGSRNNETSDAFHFVSMSDVPSYFSKPQETRFVQELGKGITANGVLVNRYYLHVAKEHNCLGYELLSKQFEKETREERTQMYEVEVLRKEKL